jgi:hypothetical protein
MNNTQKILEKIKLYKGHLINTDGVFNCRCRFMHLFTMVDDSQWCIQCSIPKFNKDMIHEINIELRDLDNNLKMYHMNDYGIGDFICVNNHTSTFDIDEIPNSCELCTNEYEQTNKNVELDLNSMSDDSLNSGEIRYRSNSLILSESEDNDDSMNLDIWDKNSDSCNEIFDEYDESLFNNAMDRFHMNQSDDSYEIINELSDADNESDNDLLDIFADYKQELLKPLIITNNPIILRENNLLLNDDEIKIITNAKIKHIQSYYDILQSI